MSDLEDLLDDFQPTPEEWELLADIDLDAPLTDAERAIIGDVEASIEMTKREVSERIHRIAHTR